MNSVTQNPSTAVYVAHQLIQERVSDAEHRAQVRAIRADRRAARQATHTNPVMPPETHHLPWWAFRFLSPVR